MGVMGEMKEVGVMGETGVTGTTVCLSQESACIET